MNRKPIAQMTREEFLQVAQEYERAPERRVVVLKLYPRTVDVEIDGTICDFYFPLTHQEAPVLSFTPADLFPGTKYVGVPPDVTFEDLFDYVATLKARNLARLLG